MKVIITGGGTGGHVFPAVAIGKEFIRRGVDILFVGSKDGFEAKIVERLGWKMRYLKTAKWRGVGLFSKLKCILYTSLGILNGIKIIRSYDASLVVGVGGYVSVPILVAAVVLRRPIVLLEQNLIPGVVNVLFAKFARFVCASFPSTKNYLRWARIIYTGNPVREEILNVEPNLPPLTEKFVVLIFGGSQGARSLNRAVFSSLKRLRHKRENIKFIHQIGFSMDVETVKDIYSKEGFEAEVYNFIEDMASVYRQSHLVICRAGATSIAEIMATGRPAVLVPYPFAAGDHQTKNAEFVASIKGAIVVCDEDLSGEKIAEVILNLMNNIKDLELMNEALKRAAKRDAANVIVNECMNIITLKEQARVQKI